MKLTYRSEIDGLRVIAVGAVILLFLGIKSSCEYSLPAKTS